MGIRLNYIVLALLALANVQHSSTKERTCDLRQRRSNTTSGVCDFMEHDRRLVCFHGLDDKWKSGGENVKTLVLCHWSLETFDPQHTLQGFPSLKKLVIANGNLTKVTSTFPPEARSIEDMAITGTKLHQVPEQLFANLLNLKSLDLRNNTFADINVAALNPPSLRHAYLSGNPLTCTESTSWILDQEKGSFSNKIADKDNLRCAAPYEGRPLVQVVEIINTLKDECKRTVCDCELVYVLGQGGRHIQRQLMAFASLNCSHRGLTEMPSFLPGNTTTLRLTGNKVATVYIGNNIGILGVSCGLLEMASWITSKVSTELITLPKDDGLRPEIHDLAPLTTNPAYKGVIDLYLDDNLVESIVQLEGSSWIDRFRLLSLRGNKLTDLPTYALANVLQHNGNAVSLYLGNNSWRCDCLFTPGFQDLLIRYTTLVKDVNDVRCSLTNGDDNSGKTIRDLTRTEICVSSDEDPLLHPLDVLNIILASLIFLIIGKLLYDYWSFKKTGKLPWIVAKIP